MANNWHPAVAAQQSQERLLRPDQAARLLGVTAQQVRKLWRQGKLKGEKYSERNLKIPESAIREYKATLNGE